MVLTCPRCRRSLSSVSAEGAPAFCMYCGQKLKEGSSAHDTRTHTFTPQEVAELSGVSDATGTQNTPTDYSADQYAPEPVPEAVGGYKLGRRLGAGGMGSVYEAEDGGSGARVAVKLLSSRLASNPSSVERFRQEGRLASQLAHPRCVFVYSADTENGRPYIVMELMPGRTLKDLVDEKGPLSQQEAIARVLDVIDGLAEAHRVGMIHRDVKPSNCFLTADDRVKVGDFGLSKSLAGGRATALTQTGAFLGTVLFASPEQIRGEPVDYSSDVYSVAATLYFLLCGEAPFQHESAAAVLARVVSEPPPHVRAKRPDVSAQLDRIIARGLDRDRARRWQTLDDLRDALCDLLPERQRPARPRALVGAYLIDRLALMLLTVPVEGVRRSLGGARGVRVEVFEIHWLPIVLMLAYFALLEGRFGTTLGKWLLGLRVSRAGETGPPGVRAGLVRTAVFHLLLGGLIYAPEALIGLLGPRAGAALGAVALVGCFVALLVQVRKKYGYRGLHDFASGCRVTQRPFPVRKLRLTIARPTPLDNVLPTAEPLPEVGGFAVLGRLCAEPTGEQVWLAEDRALGRKVLLWLRPWGGAAPPADPARPARLRKLGSGSVGWAGAAYDWTAYAAPLGGPLAETVRPGRPLAWADARYVLEQVADEFRAAEADGSLPRRLALDHIWVEPNGRVQILDFPLCAARYRPNAALVVLREAASLTLEGHPRTGGGPLAAPIPAHGLAVLNRLFAEEVPLAEFHKELAETHLQRAEVTPAVRAAHLGIQAVGLALPLGMLFGLTFTLAVWLTYIADWQANQAREAAAVLADPARRAKLAEHSTPALDDALNSPRLTVRVNELVERTRAEAETRRAALLGPQRSFLEAFERVRPNREFFGGRTGEIDVIEWAGAPEKSAAGRAAAPWSADAVPSEAVVLYGGVLLAMVLTAAALRGGLAMVLAGIAVVRADGRSAARWQCAARAALVWAPVVGLLFGSALLQDAAPRLAYPAMGLWLLAVALLPVYAVLALRYPARALHDRLTGTHLVPA